MKSIHITDEALRALCIKNEWCTLANEEQYEKIFAFKNHGLGRFEPDVNDLGLLIGFLTDGSTAKQIDEIRRMLEVEDRIGLINGKIVGVRFENEGDDEVFKADFLKEHPTQNEVRELAEDDRKYGELIYFYVSRKKRADHDNQ